MIVGYARVSTDGQTLETQIANLRQAGADKVYSETVSGAVTDRRELAKAIASLTCGDLCHQARSVGAVNQGPAQHDRRYHWQGRRVQGYG
jgi:hypothetical protein